MKLRLAIIAQVLRFQCLHLFTVVLLHLENGTPQSLQLPFLLSLRLLSRFIVGRNYLTDPLLSPI